MSKFEIHFDALRKSGIFRSVFEFSETLGIKVYIVGGGLRDLFFSGDISDFDFAVSHGVPELSEAVAKKLNGSCFPVGRGRNCYRVVTSHENGFKEIDFTSFKGNGIEEDLKHRDFTVNAIAVSVKELFEEDKPVILDPLNGIGDLNEGKLRLISSEAIDEDPLRILRGFRLAATFFLDMDEKFVLEAGKKRKKLKTVSAERIRTELFKILSAQRSSDIIERMIVLEIMDEIIPEISSWQDIDQGSRHRFDLLRHAVKTLEYVESTIGDRYSPLSRHEAGINQHLDESIEYSVTRKGMLKLAALLHDSGKPCRMKIYDDKVTFYGHDEEGAKINRRIGARLKIGRTGKRILANITKHHMRVLHLSKLDHITKRAIDRFIRDCGAETIEILLLTLADAWATRDERDIEYTDVEKVVNTLMDRYFEEEREEIVPLLRGRDIMDILAIGEGPLVGKYLEIIREKESEGIIESRDDAVKFLMSLSGEKGAEETPF